MTPEVNRRVEPLKWITNFSSLLEWVQVKVVFKDWLLRHKANLKHKDLLLEEIRPKVVRQWLLHNKEQTSLLRVATRRLLVKLPVGKPLVVGKTLAVKTLKDNRLKVTS